MHAGHARTRLLAVEVRLTEPETLGNDALETDLHIMRDHPRPAAADTPQAAQRGSQAGKAVHRGAQGQPAP
jgi:hypothetical protein